MSLARFVPSRLRDVLDPYHDLHAYNVQAYGADPAASGATNTTAFQAAIDAANAVYVSSGSGQTVYVPPGVYPVGVGGTISSRAYSLLLKSGVTLKGDSSLTTTIKLADGAALSADCDVIVTSRSSTSSNIAIKGVMVDGNEAAQAGGTGGGFNLWAYRVTDLLLEDFRTVNPSSWACRIQECSRVHINGFTSLSTVHESNADGLHMIDTSDVTGGDVYIYSASDDGLVIEAKGQDISNYAMSGIYVFSNTTRGFLIGDADAGLSDGFENTVVRTVSNMDFNSVVVEESGLQGVYLVGCAFDNCHVEAITKDCHSGLNLKPGGPVCGTAVMQNCSFDIISSGHVGTAARSLWADNTWGTFHNNRINAVISDPADNVSAIEIYGAYWSGSIELDYDPNVSKVAKQGGIVVYCSYSDLAVACRDAKYNLLVQGTATTAAVNNTFRLGRMTGASLADVQIQAGAANNTFIGGEVTNFLNSSDQSNRFYAVDGAPSKTVNAQTGTTYTLALTDRDNLVTLNNASPITLTIPANATVAFPVGTEIIVTGIGAGLVTVAAAGGVTINNPTNASLVLARYMVARLVKTGGNTWQVNKGSRPPDGTSMAINASGQIAFSPTANVAMNSHKLTGLLDGSAVGDAVAWPWPIIGDLVDVQVFGPGANQTWQNPNVGTIAVGFVKGGGGGGGGGVNSASAGNPRSGGAGGGGCGWVAFAVPIAALGSTCNVNVASGGAGGTNGVAGSDANRTTAFDSGGGNANVTAATGGAAGGSGASTGGSGGVGTAPTYVGYAITSQVATGGTGGAGTTAAASGNPGTSNSGGAGGGCDTTPTGRSAGAGATASFTVGTNGTAGTGGASATQGAPSLTVPFWINSPQSAGGGGGGGCHTNGAGAARGANGFAGGGGGGGGSCVNGPAGLGGNGGDGCVVVLVY